MRVTEGKPTERRTVAPYLAAGCVPVVLQACSPFVHGLRTFNVTVDVERDLKQSRSTSAVTFDPRGRSVRVTEGKPTERRTGGAVLGRRVALGWRRWPSQWCGAL